ncbi:MAG: peptide chain release factor N(5)-glutamine methyltransferase [Hyphomicrobiaceae bacterium]
MPEGGRTLAGAVSSLAAELRAAGIPDPEIDARLLVLAAAGATRLELIRTPDKPLSPTQDERLAIFGKRRRAHEPVSRILGRREFWTLDLEVTPAVLDPRPETELLVEAALDYVRLAGRDRHRLTILDLGTGSGAILIALVRELPSAFGIGVDASVDALEVARRNAERHGVGHRARFVAGNWADAIGRKVDLIVSNPPYLTTAEIDGVAPEVREFDPRAALDGGADGLEAYRAVVAAWQRLGQPAMLLEIGATQAAQVSEIIQKYSDVSSKPAIGLRRDLAGLPRIVTALPQIHFP